jgi:ankyrin repeat protein
MKLLERGGRALTTPVLEKEVRAAVRHMAGAAPVLFPALWTAARDGRADEVRLLLAQEIDIEQRGGPRHTSPLHEAALQARELIVRVLLEHGADASTQDNTGETPLHRVAHVGLVAIMLLLLENGAEVSVKNPSGLTALHAAAFGGHEALVFMLLEHGAEVTSKTDTQKLTPLHLAALEGHETVARVLLHKGADLQSKTNDGRSAEDIATQCSHPQVAAMLKAEAERREAARRARCEAFAMGHQERLGAGSRVRWLDAGVVRIVLEHV